MKTIKLYLFSFLSILLFGTTSLAAQSNADKVLGVYEIRDDQSSEVCKARIYKTKDGHYAGKIIWVENPYFKDGSPKTDIMNPDPEKKKTPANQIQLLYSFSYDAKENEWVDGKIYDPVHGKTYKSKMWFADAKTLKVRGYIGVPALGRTMLWKKVE